ncbi:hypothetical protein KPC83_00965 [Collinsella sp. zg1085]|nr:hypothetical protein KPC83_00965 [Collinsella sp. zg1085]
MAHMRHAFDMVPTQKTVITNLGEGVDATGAFLPAAVDRVLTCCRDYCRDIREFDADAVCVTLTSAARDASNSDDLLHGLQDLGLKPQVISGELEAQLMFLGVAGDAVQEHIVVADSGGGSTELASGVLMLGRGLEFDNLVSLNVGCRRITERYLHDGPLLQGEIDAAASFVAQLCIPYWQAVRECGQIPQRLLAVGGTVTTLAAMRMKLESYDAKLVHGYRLSFHEVEEFLAVTKGMHYAEIASFPGIQPERVPVIRGGAIIVRELMRRGEFEELFISERSLLAGVATVVFEHLDGQVLSLAWQPELSRL